MKVLARRSWVPAHCEDFVQSSAAHYAKSDAETLEGELTRLIEQNRQIHEEQCINLNPGHQCDESQSGGDSVRSFGLSAIIGLSRRKVRDGLGGD